MSVLRLDLSTKKHLIKKVKGSSPIGAYFVRTVGTKIAGTRVNSKAILLGVLLSTLFGDYIPS